VHQLFRLSTEFSDSPLADIRERFEVLLVILDLDGSSKLGKKTAAGQPSGGDAAILRVVQDRVEVACTCFLEGNSSFLFMSGAEQ